MTERKSGRTRKVIDYGKFGGDDMDDDFADSTPPPSKKTKLSNKQNNVGKQPEKKESSSRSERRTRDEKLYERELQEALELSLSQESSGFLDAAIAIDTSQDQQPPVLETEVVANSSIVSDVPPVLVKASGAADVSDDCIEILETDIVEAPMTTKRGRAAPRKYIDSDSESEKPDSDFGEEDEDASDSDDDYNESDSDFGSSKKKNSKKPVQSKDHTKKPTVVKQPAKGKQQKTGRAASCLVTSKASSSTVTSPPLATSSPVARKKTTSAINTSTSSVSHQPVKSSNQNWKAPGMAGDGQSPVVSNTSRRPAASGACVGKSPCLGGVNVKSPNSGLRLGLSRNRKFKPLHPNLKINN